ncbi:hypothetical protein JHK87_039629 [Glycine soja]|nr:hypothetical protein JHK87_039629 [Glycine soja]
MDDEVLRWSQNNETPSCSGNKTHYVRQHNPGGLGVCAILHGERKRKNSFYLFLLVARVEGLKGILGSLRWCHIDHEPHVLTPLGCPWASLVDQNPYDLTTIVHPNQSYPIHNCGAIWSPIEP